MKAGESRDVPIFFALGVPPTGEDGAKDIVLIEARDTTYDPNPANNGTVERLSALLRKP